MATVNQIKIVVEAEDRASAPIERATESTRRLGRATRDVTSQSKKDWSGLGDLFGRVLPRNLQQITRGFKGTQRQVGRLSKSFKVLKTAWASIGIGLVIIALEAIVENWDKISESLGLYNKEAEKTAETNIKIKNTTAEMVREATAYLDKIESTSTTEEERKIAVEGLNRALGAGIDIEADRTTQMEQADALLVASEKLIDAKTKAEVKANEATEEGNILRAQTYKEERKNIFSSEYVGAQTWRRNQKEAIAVLDRAAAKAKGLEIVAEGELNAVITATNKTIDDKKKSVLELKEAEREAESAKKKRIADEAADAKWLAGQRIAIAEETELRLIQDEEKRELRSLEIQHTAAKAELALRGGTLDDLLALEKGYGLDKAEIVDEYDAIEEEAGQEALANKILLGEEMFELGLTERDREELAAQQLYDTRVALAGDDEGLIKQATEALVKDLKVIQDRADDETVAAAKKTDKLRLAAKEKLVGSVSGLLRELGDAAEEGSDKQKKLAIADVLINQAVAMARAVSAAAGSVTTPPTPFAPLIFAANVATMLGTVAATFSSIKGIMGDSGAPTGGGGGGGAMRSGMASTAQVPLPARLDSPDNMQAYVVQSQLQGQMGAQARLNGQIVL